MKEFWFDVLKGANLQGVKMLCTNAEGASLKGCNFEDPSGLKANLEGTTSALQRNWNWNQIKNEVN